MDQVRLILDHWSNILYIDWSNIGLRCLLPPAYPQNVKKEQFFLLYVFFALQHVCYMIKTQL